jgi:hypothetical protein
MLAVERFGSIEWSSGVLVEGSGHREARPGECPHFHVGSRHGVGVAQRVVCRAIVRKRSLCQSSSFDVEAQEAIDADSERCQNDPPVKGQGAIGEGHCGIIRDPSDDRVGHRDHAPLGEIIGKLFTNLTGGAVLGKPSLKSQIISCPARNKNEEPASPVLFERNKVMNKQQIIDCVAKHFVSMKSPSLDGDSCKYRNKDGLRCAIGSLIPDDMYKPSFDEGGLTLSEILRSNMDLWREITGLKTYSEEMMFFLSQIQLAHDWAKPSEWPIDGLKRLMSVAGNHDLNTTIILECMEGKKHVSGH